jgi:hypothetical protein
MVKIFPVANLAIFLTVFPGKDRFLGPLDPTPRRHTRSRARPALVAHQSPAMFRRVSKSVSRTGKASYKFKFTFALANLTGVPANVDHASLHFSRGAKTSQSVVVPVEDGAAVWNDDTEPALGFVVTLYKDTKGNFQTKEYALKAQAVAGGVDSASGKPVKARTFAKTVLDLSQYASLDGSSVSAGELQYLALDSVTKTTPGTVCGVAIKVEWLRDAKTSGAATEDSGLTGKLPASACDSECSAFLATGAGEAAGDEQDLAGFALVEKDATVPEDDYNKTLGETTVSEPDFNTSGVYALTPVREGTPGREIFGDTPVPKTPGAGLSQTPNLFSSSSDKTTPVRVHIARATAPLLEEIDLLQQKLAAAVTSASVAESDAVESKLQTNTVRDELKSVTTQATFFQEKATKAEEQAMKAEAAARQAIASSVAAAKTIQTKDALLEQVRFVFPKSQHCLPIVQSNYSRTFRNTDTFLLQKQLTNRLAESEKTRVETEARATGKSLVLSKEAAEAFWRVESLTVENVRLLKRLEIASATHETLDASTQSFSTKNVAMRGANVETRKTMASEKAEIRSANETRASTSKSALREVQTATETPAETNAEKRDVRVTKEALRRSAVVVASTDSLKEAKREMQVLHESSATVLNESSVNVPWKESRTKQPPKSPLRAMNSVDTNVAAVVSLNKQLAKVTTELQAVTRRAARVDKELGLEHDLRKDLERKLVLAKETRKATEPEPNRTCSFLWA